MPRSPSRDLSDRYDGNRGYFHRRTGLGWLKHWLTHTAVGLTAGWVLFDLFFPTRAAHTHSPGALAGPHAMWEADCKACHVPFSARDVGASSLLRPAERWHALTCEKCHPGPPHHASIRPESATFHGKCSNCHHDHAGRERSLVLLSDDHCARCHANLGAHVLSGSPQFSSKITGFATDHPEFAPLVQYPEGKPYDRRALKFSHGLHMTPGLVYTKGARGEWTLDRLAELSGPEAAAKYRRPGQAGGSPVTLDCASCHQIDAGPLGSPAPGRAGAAVPPRREGAYYRPVNFDAHCKACHPLRAPAAASGKAVLAAFDVPHRKQPAELREVLAGEYARRLLSPEGPALAAVLGPTGRFDARTAPALATFQGEIDRLTGTALSAFLQGAGPPGPGALKMPSGGYACGKCHELTGTSTGPPEATRIRGGVTRPIWFPHARFNHVAHRSMTCASCHPGTGAAYFGEGWTSEKEPIRIAGIESCKQCHSPRRTVTDASGARAEVGGARHGCTDCHRYHNGDHALQARGALPR
jgi:hypothetical protein